MPAMKCYNCQGEGHMASECTEARKPREGGGGGDSRGPMKCYNCQEDGHMSRDCSKPRSEGPRGGGRGRGGRGGGFRGRGRGSFSSGGNSEPVNKRKSFGDD